MYIECNCIKINKHASFGDLYQLDDYWLFYICNDAISLNSTYFCYEILMPLILNCS